MIADKNFIAPMKKLRMLGRLHQTPLIGSIAGSLSPYSLEGVDFSRLNILPDTSFAREGFSEAFFERPSGSDIAFLQFSSGSTSEPKGVSVSHASLMHNLSIIQQSQKVDSSSVSAGWLPPYHDMGLVGLIFMTVFNSLELHFTSPQDFVKNPFSWLELISKVQATHSCGPNFAYSLLASRAKNKSFPENFSLKSLRSLLNGSEPINPSAAREFIKTFVPYGLDPKAMKTCYGLAEATLFVSCTPHNEAFTTLHIDKEELENHRVHLIDETSERAKEIVSCGRPEAKIEIVDPYREAVLREGEIGEIWISSPSLASGYWGDLEQTEDSFVLNEEGDRFLRTGDLGFIRQGQLYGCGRIKDLIIIAGKNFHPQDIEMAVSECSKLIRRGNVIAYPVQVDGREQAAVCFEAREHLDPKEFLDLVNQIRSAVMRDFGLFLCELHLLPKGGIPKTPSGKLRRHLLREQMRLKKVSPLHSFTQEHYPSFVTDQEVKDAEKTVSSKEIDALIKRELELFLGRQVEFERIKDQPFQDLGFDSLSVMEFFTRTNERLGRNFEIPFEEFFACRTPSDMKKVVANNQRQAAKPLRLKERVKGPDDDLFTKCKEPGPFKSFAGEGAEGNLIFPILGGKVSNRMMFQGKEHIVWSTNNYLGLASHPRITEAAKKVVEEVGPCFPMGSRLMSGETELTRQLEKELAEYFLQDDVMVFNYGYLGIIGIVDALTGPKDHVIVDQQAHACLVDGGKLACYENRNFRSFKHNDMEDLERILSSIREKSTGGILLLVDGVYSMLGALANLPELIRLKEKYNARLLVDDSHGSGVMGIHGRGLGEHFNVIDKIDLYFSTFAKSFAGIGGFLGAPKEVIDYLRYNCRTNVFSRGLPNVNIVTTLEALRILRSEPERRAHVWNIKKMLHNRLLEDGFELASSESLITPVLMGKYNQEQVLQFITRLRSEENIFVSGIIYPVVPKDKTMIRLISTSCHEEEDVFSTVKAFRKLKGEIV